MSASKSAACGPLRRLSLPQEKKRPKRSARKSTREVDQLLRVIFNGRRKTGCLDLEAIEMAVRSAMHQAGAAALTELLQFPAPAADQRTLPCPCGHQAHYRELRSKPVLTAVGPAKVSRPYYLCSHCHTGQFPADVELDIENTEFSPGVRRMQAVVGQEAPFDHGRQQMKLLADLEVTTKAVERTAEAIGEDIAAREQEEIQRAVQLDLPMIVGEPIPILYVQMDGTGVPVVKKETVGRQGKIEGQPAHTREAKLGCVFTQTTWDAGRLRHPRSRFHHLRCAPLKRRKSLACASIWKPASAVGAAPKRRSSSAMERNGSGILPINTSPAQFRLSIFFTPANTSGNWRANCIPTSRPSRNAG